MNLPEAIYRHSLNLPEPAASEALDFIEFLESRYGSAQKPAWRDTVLRLARSLGDDLPDDIDESDLGEDVPREAFE